MKTNLIHPIKMAVLQDATSLVGHYEYNHLTPSQYIKKGRVSNIFQTLFLFLLE